MSEGEAPLFDNDEDEDVLYKNLATKYSPSELRARIAATTDEIWSNHYEATLAYIDEELLGSDSENEGEKWNFGMRREQVREAEHLAKEGLDALTKASNKQNKNNLVTGARILEVAGLDSLAKAYGLDLTTFPYPSPRKTLLRYVQDTPSQPQETCFN